MTEDSELPAEVLRDISARREAENALSAQILENMSESVHLLRNEDSIFVYVNPAFERVFGYRSEEIVGRHVSIINATSERDPVDVADEISAVLDAHRVWEGELRNRRKSGKEFWSRASVTGFTHPVYGPVWLCIHTDIDVQRRQEAEREALEQQLVSAQRLEALGTLASGIAHDFSNVLQGMVLAIEAALEQMPRGDSPRRELERASALADRGRDLIMRILSFAQSGAPMLEEVDLREIVRETVTLLRSILPSTIDIRTRITGARMPVHGNAEQLEQILVNLCNNAAQAMRESGGTLTITLAPERAPGSSTALLSIQDTGLGIPPAHRDDIFEPFFTTKPASEGSGLGLTMVQRMVHAHSGTIDFETSQSYGTRFDVRLPLLEAGGASAGVRTPPRRPRLLFVDDEEELLEGYRSILERRGYTVSTHSNPLDALAEFRDQPEAYEALLTDQLMPELDGLQLSRAVHDLRPNLPTILLTGSPVIGDLEDTGVDAVLHKPFRTRELLDALTRVLEEPP